MDVVTFRERWALRALLLAMAASTCIAIALLRGWGPVLDSVAVPPWSLALAFGAATLFVVEVPAHRDLDAVTLWEIPLVIALFFLTPVATIGAEMVGVGVAVAVFWHSRGVKLGFNVGQVAIQPTVAILVFHAIVGGSPPHDPPRGSRRSSPRSAPIFCRECSGRARGLVELGTVPARSRSPTL